MTNTGTPKSWDLDIKNSKISKIIIPGFYLAKLNKEDRINNKNKTKPFRFGKEFLVSYNLFDSGQWTDLDNGDRIWRINFKSHKSKRMNFVFDLFYMPKNGSV